MYVISCIFKLVGIIELASLKLKLVFERFLKKSLILMIHPNFICWTDFNAFNEFNKLV